MPLFGPPRPQVDSITPTRSPRWTLLVPWHCFSLSIPQHRTVPPVCVTPSLLDKTKALHRQSPVLEGCPTITRSSTKVFDLCLLKPRPSSRAGGHVKPGWDGAWDTLPTAARLPLPLCWLVTWSPGGLLPPPPPSAGRLSREWWLRVGRPTTEPLPFPLPSC